MNFTWENPFIIRCLSPVNSLFACRSCGCWVYEKITFYKTHSWFTWIKKRGGRTDWSKQTFDFGWFIGWLFINFVRLLGIYQRNRLPSIFSNLLTLCWKRHDFWYFANDCIASPCYLPLYNSFCDIYYFIHLVQMLFLFFSSSFYVDNSKAS